VIEECVNSGVLAGSFSRRRDQKKTVSQHAAVCCGKSRPGAFSVCSCCIILTDNL